MEGFINEPTRFGQIMVSTFKESVNLPLAVPMALHSSSCSSHSARQPGHSGWEGTRAGGSGRGGSAAKAGASNAAAPGVHPVPGGSADSSTATAAGGAQQWPRDHHFGSALALALAFASFSVALVPGSRWPLCSMGQASPHTQAPASQSGHTPGAAAPGLGMRLAARPLYSL